MTGCRSEERVVRLAGPFIDNNFCMCRLKRPTRSSLYPAISVKRIRDDNAVDGWRASCGVIDDQFQSVSSCTLPDDRSECAFCRRDSCRPAALDGAPLLNGFGPSVDGERFVVISGTNKKQERRLPGEIFVLPASEGIKAKLV